MARLFRDAPEAIAETMKLSEALTFSLDELRYEYPDESIEGFDNAQDALTHVSVHRPRPSELDAVQLLLCESVSGPRADDGPSPRPSRRMPTSS